MYRIAPWLVTCAAVLFAMPLTLACPAVTLVHAEELGEPSPIGPSDDDDSASETMLAEIEHDANEESAEPSDAAVESPVPNPNASTNYTITPVVANEKAKPRDIIKKELTVTNNTNRVLKVYGSVRNIDPKSGEQIFESSAISDLSTSLANWIEITRGVIKLGPGESRKIPYLIHVNLTAKPGSYFARIQFTEGPRRNEDRGPDAVEEGTSLMLNVEVLDDADERLQLGTFNADDSVVTREEASFSFLLENVGNREIEPRGSIRIFNRKGEEVGSVPLNSSGEGITPENKKQLAAVWDATGRFGRYKAFLDLEYGVSQRASVQDTVYFWVFPWKEVMFALLGVGLLAVIGTYVIHMRSIARPVHAHAQAMQPSPQPSFTPARMAPAQPSVPTIPQYHAPASHVAQPQPEASGRPVPVQQGALVVQARRSGVRVSGATGAVAAPSRLQQNRPTVQGDTISLARRR